MYLTPNLNTIPINEVARLDNLRDYHILDTPPEEPFNLIAASLTQYYSVPYSAINFVDKDRVWVKANKWGEAGESVERSLSICTHTIDSYDLTVVEDTLKVDFIKSMQYVVTEPYIRFYAGAPITTAEGYNIGIVCIYDTAPRFFSRKKLEKLKVFADKVRIELERRLENSTII